MAATPSVLNTYPPEIRTPPLPLVAFVGCQELHKDIGTFFSQVLRPPLVSLGVADASEHLLTRLFGRHLVLGGGGVHGVQSACCCGGSDATDPRRLTHDARGRATRRPRVARS